MNKFVKICKKTQEELKEYLPKFLKSKGYKPVVKDGFIYAKGDTVLLTAHMDTVHTAPVDQVIFTEKGNRVSSPEGIGGDDRCGIYIIMQILNKTDLRPSILFCEDEEIGGIGSNKFNNSKYADQIQKLKFFIELDRMDAKDAVFYNCDNPEFTEWIISETGYTEAYGSFSDISHLCPAAGIAGVNLSCGYYNPHTLKEYVLLDEMENTINVTINLIEAAKAEEVPQFEYIEAKRPNFYGRLYDYDYDYDYDYKGIYGGVWIEYYDPATDTTGDEFVYGNTLEEAVGRFLMNHPTMSWGCIYNYEEY